MPVKGLLSLPRLLQTFFRVHLIDRGNMSQHTVRAYRDAIKLLLTFVATRVGRDVTLLDIDDLGRDSILAFLSNLETQRGNSTRTRNARLAAIHSFFHFVAAEEPAHALLCHQALSIPYKRSPKGTVTCLERADIEHILAAIDRGSPEGRRDLALFQFLYNTGARAQELVDLRMSAVRMEHPAQVRILGKGRKERLTPLWEETTALLSGSLRDRGHVPDDSPLFVNAWGKQLTRFGVWHIVRSRVAVAAASRPSLGKKKISPHTLRHNAARRIMPHRPSFSLSWRGFCLRESA